MDGHDNYRQFAAVREFGDTGLVLHVFGDIDLSTAEHFRAALDDAMAAASPLLLNLVKCRYCDSSGLSAIAAARRRIGANLTVLVKEKSQISRVMQLVGFGHMLRTVTDISAPFGLPDRTAAS